MITKKTFVKLMKALEKQDKLDDEYSKALDVLQDPEFRGAVFTTQITSEIVRILGDEFGKGEASGFFDDISYFIYELDWGRDWERGKVTDGENNDIRLKTAEDLYDLLIGNPNLNKKKKIINMEVEK